MANSLMTVQMITREAVELFKNTNVFLQMMDGYGANVVVLREPMPYVSLPVAAAMGAAAVIIKNPVVSRRFWSA